MALRAERAAVLYNMVGWVFSSLDVELVMEGLIGGFWKDSDRRGRPETSPIELGKYRMGKGEGVQDPYPAIDSRFNSWEWRVVVVDFNEILRSC